AAKFGSVPAPQKPWKKLAAELTEHGIDSKYLARVEARVTPEEQLDKLQREIAEEMASALGRSGDKVDLALAELELHEARFDRAVRQGASLAERSALADAFNAQRLLAQRRLRELLIHREALGFRRNQILNELYPIPPKLTI
ncbi:MAG TPA: hypothetical protein VHZ95_22700, partial [Polyangiales bacterium]|nr:hypothetical protein [Polyangiales bacterium]